MELKHYENQMKHIKAAGLLIVPYGIETMRKMH